MDCRRHCDVEERQYQSTRVKHSSMFFMQLLVVVRIGIVPEEFLYAIEEGSTGLGCLSEAD